MFVIYIFNYWLNFYFIQYVGDPIECIKRDKEIDPKLIDTYCWIHGTYTQQPIEAGKMQTHEKRNHLKFGSCNPQKEDCWHHAYYQFVVMVLVLQAACFYFPWYVIYVYPVLNIVSIILTKF